MVDWNKPIQLRCGHPAHLVKLGETLVIVSVAVDGQVVKIPYTPSGRLVDFAGFHPLRGDAYDIVNREATR